MCMICEHNEAWRIKPGTSADAKAHPFDNVLPLFRGDEIPTQAWCWNCDETTHGQAMPACVAEFTPIHRGNPAAHTEEALA